MGQDLSVGATRGGPKGLCATDSQVFFSILATAEVGSRLSCSMNTSSFTTVTHINAILHDGLLKSPYPHHLLTAVAVL